MAPVHKVNNWSNMLKALELKMQKKCRQSFSLLSSLLLFIVVSCRVSVFFSRFFCSQSELSILSLSQWNRSSKDNPSNSQTLAYSFLLVAWQCKALLMHQFNLCIRTYIFSVQQSRTIRAIRQHKTRQSMWTCNSGSYALIQCNGNRIRRKHSTKNRTST